MTALAYSREHTCSNTGAPLIWQPAGRRFYCPQCHSVEAPAEYRECLKTKVLDSAEIVADDPPTDQPEPPRYA